MKKKEDNDQDRRRNLQAISLGTELVTPIILGGLIGFWIDKSKGYHSKWTLILLILGLIIGIYNFIKIVRKLNQ